MVRYLRGENGCPWDKAQGLHSMLHYLKEEKAELAEALDKDDFEGVSEEWGDTFFIFLMFAAIAEETGRFDLERSLRAVEAKMIRRHPHVFGGGAIDGVEQVLEQWNRIKAREKQQRSQSLMDAMPQFSSALKRAQHVQKKAAEVGFDWPNQEGILKKVEEESRELREALHERKEEETAGELGDLLFSCVNLARFIDRDAESLLNKTTDKFIERFMYMERELHRAGKSAREASLEEMDRLWEQAKERNRDES